MSPKLDEQFTEIIGITNSKILSILSIFSIFTDWPGQSRKSLPSICFWPKVTKICSVHISFTNSWYSLLKRVVIWTSLYNMRYDARERVLLIISGHSITTAELSWKWGKMMSRHHCSLRGAGGRERAGQCVSIVVAHSDAVSATKWQSRVCMKAAYRRRDSVTRLSFVTCLDTDKRHFSPKKSERICIQYFWMTG